MTYSTKDYEMLLQELRLKNEELEIERERYRAIAELTDCAIWEYDIDTKKMSQLRKLEGRYADKNLEILDYRNTVLNWGLIYPDDIPIFNHYCDSLDLGDSYFDYELRALGDNDDYIWMRFQGTSIKDKNGKVKKIMGKTMNVDQDKKDREKLIQKSERDSQTGLYNKTTSIEKINKCFERSNYETSTEKHALMIIDIDNFKQINDRLGHLYGDIILENFAAQLKNLFEKTDLVGRVGGDEFVILQKGINNESEIMQSANAICDMVRNNLPGLKEEGKVSVSIGIAIFPQDGITYEEVFKMADLALYEAKSNGKDNFILYNKNMDTKNKRGETERKKSNKKDYHYDDAPDVEKRLLDFTFDIISETSDIESAVNKIFTEVGKYYSLSRITIFEEETTNQKAKVSYEWINQDIKSLSLHLKKKDSLMNQYEMLFKMNEIYYCNDVTKIHVTEELRKLYNDLGTKGLIQCPIYDSNKFIGIVNYEDCLKPREWLKTELDTLSTITRIISNYIVGLRSKEELSNEIFFTQAMLNNQKLSNYAIKPDTYELMYVNEYTEYLFPNVKLGEVCYKAIFGRKKPCETCPVTGLTNCNRYSVEAYNEKMDAWLSTTASTVDTPSGQKMCLICSSDVTGFIDRVKSKDILTGLITLSKFEAEAMKLIASAKNIQYAILYYDFDKFKFINDEWGYSLGNEILKYFAKRMSRLLSSTELFCRISGDTFVILLSYRNKDEALNRIDMIKQSIQNDYNKQYPKVNPIIITGVYFMTPDDKILSVAMDKANIARKKIKGSHKSNYAIYDETLHNEITREKMIENQMVDAIQNKEFIVYMQPKVDLRTLEIIGAETLVRWRTSDGLIMNPMEFIPIFEKNGFILELDYYVFEESFKALRSWLDLGKEPLILSINVSRLHIADPYFLSKLTMLVLKYQLPTNLIEIEITESIFLDGIDRLCELMLKLRDKGYLISIDDFGSGYSSLNLLKKLPVDIIKIDKEFFMANTMDEKDKIVITNIINLAKGLGLKVIAEGVETLEQARFLRECNCDMVQGYFFYKPMPLEDFENLII
jgi:diguanylate cyclase (GGDEF)-like protein